MAKQTFTTGQVLTAAQMTDLQQTAMTGGAASTKTVSYVLVAADAGTRVAMNAAGSTTITVNTGLFSAGDTVSIQNIGAGVCTVTAGTATVNTSGSLVLAQYQGGILYFTSASAAIFFQFATPASGDIEGVTAGTGISGGGTSGTVTITNSMATEITAAGDIIVGTGNGTFDNLPIGSTGQLLTADTTVSPYKVKWATPAAASSGMTLIARTSFTNVASQTFDNFSTTYNSYMVIIESIWNVNQNDANLRLIMRYGGTDGTAHFCQATTNPGGGATWTSLNTPLNSAYAEISPDTGLSINPNIAVIYFTNGFQNANQDAQFFGTFMNVNGNAQTLFNGANLSNQQYTGFKLQSSTQNIDGTVAIYGLAKA